MPDVFYFLSIALTTAAAEGVPRHTDAASPASARAIGISLLPYAAAGFGYILLLSFGSQAGPLAPVGGAVLTLLVFVRQVLASRVHAEMSAALATQMSEARFRSLVQRSSDPILIVDAEGRIVSSTPSAEAVLRSDGELAGVMLRELIAPESWAAFTRLLLDSQANPFAEGEVELLTSDGGRAWMELKATDLLDDPNVAGIVLNGRDVTARRALEGRLAEQALHDPLTGLANRTLFEDRFAQHLLRRGRRGQMAVLFIDLDDFKSVNDTLGHLVGDQVLRVVALRLRESARDGDTVARLGGDEFAILVQDEEPESTARGIADRLLRAMDAPVVVAGREATVRVSVGIAVDPGASTVLDLLRDADLAMYSAKMQGKGRVEMFTRVLSDTVADNMDLQRDLGVALTGDQLFLAYQPIIRLRSGAVQGLEALLRWRHPVRGLVSPRRFIPVAESGGLIVPIGRWALEQACRECRDLVDGDGLPMPLSVNVSERQVREAGFVAEIQAVLAATGMEPGRLTLEFPERLVVQGGPSMVGQLERIRALGVRLAVDDFGTGYSSLSYLHALPVDVLKVDGSLVARLGSGGESTSMVRAIVALGDALGLSAVAEGIETEMQLQVLVDLGCLYGQGHLLARPAGPDSYRSSSAMGTARAGSSPWERPGALSGGLALARPGGDGGHAGAAAVE